MREYQVLMMGEIDVNMILKWVLGAAASGLTVALIGGAVATATQELTADEQGLSDTFA